MKKSKHSILDLKTKELMKKLNIKPRICEYCKGEYYPHVSINNKSQWEEQRYCSSICIANDNCKTPKTFYFGLKLK